MHHLLEIIMNGNVKFHKPNGPAFAAGEQWVSCGGKLKVTITSVTRIGDDKFDYRIEYLQSDGTTANKGAWEFQVRYQHVADLALA